MDDSMDDDVFEATEETTSGRLKVIHNDYLDRSQNTPSPTGYRDYKPPAEVLKMCENDIVEESEQRVHKVKYLYLDFDFFRISSHLQYPFILLKSVYIFKFPITS